MNIFIRFLLRLASNEFVEELNAISLDELDARGLIIWEGSDVHGSIAKPPTTERVVNIIWTKEEWWREGFDTASVFRVINAEHELFLTRGGEFVIEAVGVEATPLTCSLNKFLHEHGCYSADD